MGMYKIDRRGRGGPKSYTRTDPKIVYRIFFDGFHFKIRSYNVNFLRDYIFHETYCALVIKILCLSDSKAVEKLELSK